MCEWGAEQIAVNSKVHSLPGSSVKMLARAMLVSPCLVLLLLASLGLAEKVPSGGCLSQNTTIPKVAAGQLNGDLANRINDIRTGGDQGSKTFMNREGCLPPKLSYLEFRLYPQVADANRIVQQLSSGVFYFTKDHYTSFYKVY